MGFVAGLFPGRVPSPDDWTVAYTVCERLLHLGGEPRLVRVGQASHAGMLAADGLDVASVGEGDERWAVALDGCIGNAAAVGRTLLDSGHGWSGTVGAGLVLDAWRAWGVEMLKRLQGSFAFALFDPTSGSVHCARDRWGRRPLFYACTDDGFVFASELPALLLWPGVRRMPDYDVVATIMSFGHATAERAPFEGVHRVPPGHVLTWRPGTDVTTTAWDHRPVPGRSTTGLGAEAGHEFRRRLDGGLARALRGHADAEVIGGGCAGISLEASASRLGVRTRSAASEHLHPRAQLRAMTRMLWHQGEPLVPLAGLDLHTRLLLADGPVLSTAGGAELQLGHGHYAAFAQRLAKLESDGADRTWSSGYWPTGPLKRDLYHAVTGLMSEAERLSLCGPALIHTTLFAAPDVLGPSLEAATPETAPDLASRLDLAFRVPALELALLGAAEAATGVKAACPFLDDELATWCLGLAPSDRAAISRELAPAAGRESQSRVAPGIQQLAGEILLDRKCLQRGVFARAGLERLVQNCLNGDLRQARALWAMLCIELWFVDFIDQPPRPPVSARTLVTAIGPEPMELKH